MLRWHELGPDRNHGLDRSGAAAVRAARRTGGDRRGAAPRRGRRSDGWGLTDQRGATCRCRPRRSIGGATGRCDGCWSSSRPTWPAARRRLLRACARRNDRLRPAAVSAIEHAGENAAGGHRCRHDSTCRAAARRCSADAQRRRRCRCSARPSIVAEDRDGERYQFVTRRATVERTGALRAVIRLDGGLQDGDGAAGSMRRCGCISSPAWARSRPSCR